MITLKEIVEEIKVLKDVINRIEIKGEQNANFVLFSCQKCDALTEAINAAIKSDEAGE